MLVLGGPGAAYYLPRLHPGPGMKSPVTDLIDRYDPALPLACASRD
jgi:hypothetical protein